MGINKKVFDKIKEEFVGYKWFKEVVSTSKVYLRPITFGEFVSISGLYAWLKRPAETVQDVYDGLERTLNYNEDYTCMGADNDTNHDPLDLLDASLHRECIRNSLRLIKENYLGH